MADTSISRISGKPEFSLSMENYSDNASELYPLPRELSFNSDSFVSVICYGLLFVVGAIGNLTGKKTLYKIILEG